MSESALRGCGAARKRIFVAASVMLFCLALAAPQRAGADQESQKSGLPGVTIEARQERQAVRRRVNKFVTSVIVRPWDDTLLRWNTPVCPLVAGLPRGMGELILERISQAALDARAPLDGSKCRPNLYVVATAFPEEFLKKWWDREPRMYDIRHGIPPVRRFIESKLPVRAWYNSSLECGSGTPPISGASSLAMAGVASGGGMSGGGMSSFSPGAPACTNGVDTHLTYAAVHSISSAIVVIDLRRLHKMALGQLADYVALLGLADVRPDADTSAAPSILELFAGHAAAPPGLTPWDRALLYSLYTTRQTDKEQVQSIESAMVSRIAP